MSRVISIAALALAIGASARTSAAPVPPAAAAKPEPQLVGRWEYDYGSMLGGWIEFGPVDADGFGIYRSTHARFCALPDYTGLWWVDRTGSVHLIERRIGYSWDWDDDFERATFADSSTHYVFEFDTPTGRQWIGRSRVSGAPPGGCRVVLRR